MEAVMPSVSSHYDTEEKTEPFNSSEYIRLVAERQKQQQDEANAPNSPNALGTSISNIHLDELAVPLDKDFRILVRPVASRLVSPGKQESCKWVALRSERGGSAGAGSESDDADYTTAPVETVLAVTQTSKDTKFTVHMPGERHPGGTPIPSLLCELYYDTTSDYQILVNHCEMPINLSRVYPFNSSQMSFSSSLSSSSPPSSFDSTPMTHNSPIQDDLEHIIYPSGTRALSPGTWQIKMNDIEVLDLRILERRRPVHMALHAPPAIESQTTTSSGKRSFSLVVNGDDDNNEGPEARRRKVTGADVDGDSDTNVSPNSKESAVQFIRPTADPLISPLPRPHSNALLDLHSEDSVIIPGSHDADEYTVTRFKEIASTSLSTVYTGRVDNHQSVPTDRVVIVKVIKTRTLQRQRPPFLEHNRIVATVGGNLKPHELEHIAILQADTWQREVDQHGGLQHQNIVRLYGADARCLSLYMEHVDALDLSKVGMWRQLKTDYFMGDRADATRILRDIADALDYVHNLEVVHNDIKPANILYSRERGAVLCDLGLSTNSKSDPKAGGTPYYLPPEFIVHKRRGPPGDVWGLGITLLYVLRKIPSPDTRGARHRPNPLYWKIAEVNARPKLLLSPPSPGKAHSIATDSLPAVEKMRMWLSEINEVKETLNLENKIEWLTYQMLKPNPKERITMQQVANACRGLEMTC